MSGLSAETLKKVIENETAVLRARVAKLEAALKEMHELALRDGMRWGPAIADAEAALSETVEA